MQHLFISHASADEGWAEWIAVQFREAGFSVELDVWEWAPGDDFIVAMENGLRRADAVIAVYSKAYFTRPFAQVEHRAAFAVMSTTGRLKVIPVQVEVCSVPELYSSLIRIDIAGLDEETAKRRLLAGISAIRRSDIQFPGTTASRSRIQPSESSTHSPTYPGQLPPVWRVPRRNNFFVGRSALLHELDRRFRATLGSKGETTAAVLLQGISGIGKSQIAVEYAFRYSDKYGIAWWVDAETSTLLMNALISLARRLGLSGGTPAAIIDDLWELLANRPDWLLIYDNVESPSLLSGLRPPPTGDWLITSRNPAIGRFGETMGVIEFDRAESVHLLRIRVMRLSAGQADRVADALGDLPLAVEQAGYFLADTGLNVEEYIPWLARHPLDAGLDDSTVDRHPGLVAAVSASFRQLEESSPFAANLLSILALLAPEPLPIVPQRDVELGVPASFGVSFGDVITTAEVIRQVTARGLARRLGSSLQLHRLVQLLIRTEFSSSQRDERLRDAAQLLASSNAGRPADSQSWAQYASLLPHVQAAVFDHAVMAAAPDTGEFVEVVLDLIEYLYRSGQYEAGLELSTACLEQCRASLGERHLYTLRMMNNRGMCLTGLERYEAASGLYRFLWSEYAAVLGPDHLRTLGAGNNVAVTLVGLQRYEEALEIHRLTHELICRVAGDRDVRSLRFADNLGETLALSGRTEEARLMLEKTFALRNEVLGDSHPDALDTGYNLAMTIRTVDSRRALGLLRETYERQCSSIGAAHPSAVKTRLAIQQMQQSDADSVRTDTMSDGDQGRVS